MGTPVGPVTYGEDCLLCYPVGETPKFAHLVLHNVQKCPDAPVGPPNDREFTLIQSPEFHCLWQYVDEAIIISLYYDPAFSTLTCDFQPDYDFFIGISDAPCMKEFANTLLEGGCGVGQWGWGGTAKIWFLDDPIPNVLCETMGFSPGAGNLSHKTPTIADMADYRIANPRDKTNVLFRVDTSVINPP